MKIKGVDPLIIISLILAIVVIIAMIYGGCLNRIESWRNFCKVFGLGWGG